ncbi:MAG: nucleotidyltransferase family protein [Burkholderiales bacterium]|nr:nucleotidyltransferase family protein [Burkholderiales bacterium]
MRQHGLAHDLANSEAGAMIPHQPIHAVDMSNLAEQIREALNMFARNGTEPALIGGLAVVAHQVVRATKDVDFLLEAEAADKVHDALLDLGYQCLYRSEESTMYARKKVLIYSTHTARSRAACWLRQQSASRRWDACVSSVSKG